MRSTQRRTQTIISSPRPPATRRAPTGFSWTKPDLGPGGAEGIEAETNAILPGRPVYPFGPFVDGRPGVPAEERYKAVARHVGGPQRHLMAYTSADGNPLAHRFATSRSYPRLSRTTSTRRTWLSGPRRRPLRRLRAAHGGRPSLDRTGHVGGLHGLVRADAHELQRHRDDSTVAAPVHEPDAAVLPRSAYLRRDAGPHPLRPAAAQRRAGAGPTSPRSSPYPAAPGTCPTGCS